MQRNFGIGASPVKQKQGAYTISPEEKKKLDSSGRSKSTASGDKVTAAISSVFSDKSYKELKSDARKKYPRYAGKKVKVKKITADEFTR